MPTFDFSDETVWSIIYKTLCYISACMIGAAFIFMVIGLGAMFIDHDAVKPAFLRTGVLSIAAIPIVWLALPFYDLDRSFRARSRKRINELFR